jgi:acetoin utilization deacetylase AcuC-like enzyme
VKLNSYLGDVENPRCGIRKIKKSIVSYPLEDITDENVFNKLVRDRIPDIIKAAGKEPVLREAKIKKSTVAC